MDKRAFLKRVTLLGLSAPFFGRLDSMVSAAEKRSARSLAADQDFWAAIRSTYQLRPEYINLESGFYCIQPEDTLEQFIKHVREVNHLGSYYMRNYRLENKARVAAQLAEMAGCQADELIITRNTTESLDTVIGGLDWQPGDEAVYANQDYGAMRNMFQLVADRYGVVPKIMDVPSNPKNDEEVVEAYAAALTSKTRLLMVSHIINITGHILPVRKICDMAHARGVDVMVDGAHAFGHFDFSISDLDCDYYGTSLHKWLSAPLGAGFLYVRKGQAAKVWPLFAETRYEEDDILKLNHTGTHPDHTDLAIADAMEYLNRIGIARKESRLRHLQNHWTKKAREMDHVILYTPEQPHRSCAIATVGIRGMEPADMAKRLLEEHKIWTVAINGGGVHGCRITPNIFNTIEEMDALLEALQSMA